jgi:hypothetical protein
VFKVQEPNNRRAAVSEEYAKKVTRSRRIPSSARKGRVLRVNGDEVQLSLPMPKVTEKDERTPRLIVTVQQT